MSPCAPSLSLTIFQHHLAPPATTQSHTLISRLQISSSIEHPTEFASKGSRPPPLPGALHPKMCSFLTALLSSQCDTTGQLCPAQGTQHLQSNQTWTGQPRGKCYGFPVSHIIPEEKTLLDPGWKKEKLGQCRELAKKGPEEPVTFTAPEHLPWASLLPLTLCQAKLGTWSSSASGKQCRIYGIFS